MATATNRWQLGVMYYQGNLNGQPFFTQPEGPGTAVSPTQVNGAPWPEYPIAGQVLQEMSPWWIPGCGHSIKTWKLIREYDYETAMSCCLVACEVCSYVQNSVEPYEEILDPIQRAIIIA